MAETIEKLLNYWNTYILPATGTTIYIVTATVIIGGFFGFLLSILLVLWGPNGLNHKRIPYQILNILVNIVRSIPLLILIIILIPLTRKIIGTSIGSKATIVPLTIACIASTSRMFENTFISVEKSKIEAARSYGATNLQIFYRVILKESVPAIINIITITIIVYIAGTTIASSIGGGGLGALALTYGYQSFNNYILYFSVVVLIILVNIVQFVGQFLYKKFK